MEAGILRLTDPLGGAIQIYQFCEQRGFGSFKDRFLKGYDPSRSLQLILLELEDGELEDVLLIKKGSSYELHIHGGDANARAFEQSLDQLGLKIDDEPVDSLDQLLREATGQRTISYLLELLSGETEKDQRGWEIEGFEFLRPLKLVLVGPPNAGKSTFFNWMLGANQALVSDIEGTTRDVLSARISLDGCEVDLIDTAGLDQDSMRGRHVGGDTVMDQSTGLSLKQLGEADLVLAFNWPSAAEELECSEVISVVSKADVDESVQRDKDGLRISVHSGQGLDRLISILEDWVRRKRPVRVSPRWNESMLHQG